MTITLIAAVARNGVIGRDGGIPWRLPGEQRRFKEATVGHVLVMGRGTFESIGRALPGRTTVVVTRDAAWPAPDGVLVAGDVESALQQAADIDEEVYVAGGAAVYAAALPRADRLLMTWVDDKPEGDVWFPSVTWSDWTVVHEEPADGYTVVDYRRTA